MNWLIANRLGHMAAAKAHGRLGVDPAGYPVDVNAAIAAADLPLMYRPMPRLFGIYMESDGNLGILVNSALNTATRRHTAAHELGHHELKHRPDPSRQCAIESTGSSGPNGARIASFRAQGQVEMTAEAFAAWFTMPRKAVLAALADLGIGRPTTPAEVYQLSLLLGTSYRAACRHLVNTRIVAQGEAGAWARVQPGRIKREAASTGGYDLDSTRDVDVWSVAGPGALVVNATVGDLLVLDDQNAAIAAELSSFTKVAEKAGKSTFRCAAPLPSQLLGGDDPSSTTRLTVHARPQGIYIPDSNTTDRSPDSEVF